MKKIAVVMPSLLPMPPVKGGAVETLADGILKMNEIRARLQLYVYSIPDSYARIEAQRYIKTQFRNFPPNGSWKSIEHFMFRVFKKFFNYEIMENRSYIKRIIKDIKREKYDAVIVENDVHYAYEVIKKIRDIPVFLHLHNDFMNNSVPVGVKAAKLGINVIAVSEYIKKRALSIKELDESRVSVLENCVEVSRFNRTQHEGFRKLFREEHGIGENETVFIFTGRFIWEKGVLETVESFVKLNDPHTKLIIVGSGWFSDDSGDEYSMKVKEIADKAGGRIIFTGFIPHREIGKYYAVADVAILPSIWEEPSGLTVLESLAAGLPVITTNVGGIKENVSSECAVIVEKDKDIVENLCEAMRKLASDEELRKEMSRAGSKFVLSRNYNIYYNNFIKIIHSVLYKDPEKAKEIEKEYERQKMHDFRPYFQPFVDMRDGKIIGAEALARKIEAGKDPVLPDEFVPMMVNNRIISDLDFHIFHSVCEWISERERKGKKKVFISCNFSRISFSMEDFFERITEVLRCTGCDPEYIAIEITENEIFEDTDEAVKLLEKLRGVGIKIVLDDFGKGNASIKDLCSFKFDGVKIDKMFVDIIKRETCGIVLKGMVRFFDDLKFMKICEGIEKKEQCDLLKEYGYDIAQGYYFYNSMPLEDFEKLLDENFNAAE